MEQKNERAAEFLKHLGNGKSLIEIENDEIEDENIALEYKKIYKREIN